MKQILLIGMGLLALCCSPKKQTGENDAQNEKKILVAYFSCTGNTEKVANAIAEANGGTLYKITPAQAYSAADLDWTDKSSRSTLEMTDKDSRPELGGEVLDLEEYDIIFLGYPIWWDLCPRPVNSFLEKYDFSGKTVIPFATSGSSPLANSAKTLKELYPDIEWQEGVLLNGGPDQASDWAASLAEKE